MILAVFFRFNRIKMLSSGGTSANYSKLVEITSMGDLI